MTVKQEYKVRINKVLLYIEQNISSELKVEELAERACFSKYHFNRIFKSVTGESVYHYIKRVRLERASFFLTNYSSSVSKITQKCGFGSISNFSDSFKKYYGESPTQYRKQNSFHDQDFEEIDAKVKFLPYMRLAYVKNIGSYSDNNENKNLLTSWVESIKEQNKSLRFIRLGYDSILITKELNYRFDLCYIIPPTIQVPQEISIKELHEQKVASFKAKTHSNVESIAEQCGKLSMWITENGYEFKMDLPVLIIYESGVIHSDDDDRSKLFEMEICIPINK